MKYIVVDLEMNPVSKAYPEKRRICLQEIIEIGAVVLDENLKEISSFMTYVKPQYNAVIERKIAKLTRITTEMVENAPGFEEAIEMFASFCKSLNDAVQFVEWSDSDLLQLKKEIEQKEYTISVDNAFILDNWYDFQHEFDEILGLENQVSLKNALMYAREDFVGNMHDALYDARNTAELFTIARDEEKKAKTLDKVVKILHPEETKVTLGDMFDFDAILAGL